MAERAKDEEETRARKVFVSSTYLDNVARREIVERAIVSAGMVPVGMERFTADANPTTEACVELVRGCDCLVGIVAYRYGWIPEGEARSITEMEYDAAIAKELPCLMFELGSTTVDFAKDIDQGSDQWDKQAKLRDFKAKFSRDQMPGRFADNTLGMQVLEALQEQRTRWAEGDAVGPQGVSDRELRRYLDKVETTHAEVHLAGFETAVRVPLSLDDLYVPLDAVLDRHAEGHRLFGAGQMEGLEGGLGGHREEIPLAEAFACAQKMNGSGLVLLGDPGSGKTTHLKQVLLEVVRRGPESIGLPEGTVPVFLPLRNLRELSRGMPGFIEQELADPLLSLAPSFGRRLVARGKLLFLLDGLDEVSDASERAEATRWIEAARKAGGGNYFLVSCRYAGYTDEAKFDGGFIELNLRPMNDGQVREFVTRWYRIVEAAMNRDKGRAAEIAAEKAGKLLELLDDSELTAVARVYEMTRNPLLLTAICLVHRDLGDLPDERVKLYEKAVSVLLERWRKVTKKLPVVLPAAQAVQVLQSVAYWMHGERGRKQASAAELREPVAQGLASLRGVELEPETFLKAIRDESGLLTGWGIDSYGFMHLGFQEYLAAGAIRERAFEEVGRGEGVLDRLARCFGESWWQEVILLLLAQGDRVLFDRFMSTLVRRPGFAAWWNSQTMALCLNEGRGASARPFVEFLCERPSEGRWGKLSRWLSGRPLVGVGVEQQQLAVAQFLAQVMPDALEGLDELLREHPAEAVRKWWWRRRERGAARRRGEVITAPRGGVELVLVEGGRFWMGSPEEEKGRDVYGDNTSQILGLHPESPRHEVELSSFYLAKTPVTNAQYGEFLKAKPRMDKPEFWGDRQYNQPQQPVVGVSWTDARAYCEWAGLVLPTEAQWEYACRARATTRYSSGDDEADLARVGWYGGNSGGRLHVVGEKEQNALGLYDMHGNVWEWCADKWGSYAGAEPERSPHLR